MRNVEAGHLAAALARDPSAWTKSSLERRWSPPALRASARAGLVTAILPGIYVGTEHAQSVYSRASAATLWAGSTSVLMGTGAAVAWNLVDAPPSRVTVSAEYGADRPRVRWLTVRRLAGSVPAAEWGRCPVATPAFTVVTSFGEATTRGATAIAYRAVQQRLATADEIASACEQLPRIRGRRALESVLAAAEQGCESHLESIGMREVFSGGSFAQIIRQHRLVTGGRAYRLDCFDPATRTNFELDGGAYHDAPGHVARDRRRDATLAAIGILTVRFSYRDVVERPQWCREIALAVLTERASGSHSHAGRAPAW